jgi:endonuclease/exonuclease/phosphatase (EEP) superfamily protein YafD
MQSDDSDSQAAKSSRHGWLWRGCLALAWLTALSLAAVAALRIFAHDAAYPLICVNAFTRYVYLPAYVCLAWGIWQRRWNLATLSAAIVALHVVLIAPDFRRDRRFEQQVSGRPVQGPNIEPPAPALRIYFANVKASNERQAEFMQEVAAADPDVIVFVEFLYHWRRHLALTGALNEYPHESGPRRANGVELAVLSKWPIENKKWQWSSNRQNFSCDVKFHGQTLRLFCLHSPRPMYIERHDYAAFWDDTIPAILSQRGPAVVVGDFNATQYSAVLKSLTSVKFRSAHEDRGRGWATTWPNGAFPIPPIRIDHALLSQGVECIDIREGRGFGSDHKPLILDIRLKLPADHR